MSVIGVTGQSAVINRQSERSIPRYVPTDIPACWAACRVARSVVHRFASTQCAAGTAVVFYQVDDGGHTWPGGPQYLPKAIIGPTTHTFGASEAIGQFFAAHSS